MEKVKKDLVEESEKLFVDEKEYTLYTEDYLDLYKKLKGGVYKNIRNYYKEAKEFGWLDEDNFSTYAKELNCVLWKSLLATKKSRNDFQNLNKTIDIFHEATTKTLQKINNSKDVLEYISELGYASYLDFVQYFMDSYGVNVEEYIRTKANAFNTNVSFSDDDWSYEYESIYNSTHTLDTVMMILRKNKDEFLSSTDDGSSMLADAIEKKTLYPVYKQNYGLPTLEAIESNKVVLEFNILDDKKDIMKLVDEIYKKEKPYKKSLYSSEKLELLKNLSSMNKDEKLYSITVLKKASILYQYTQDKDEDISLEHARNIYNFHVFLYACNNRIKGACNRLRNDDNEEYITCKSDDTITENLKKKEIRKQIKIIKSLLNFNE